MSVKNTREKRWVSTLMVDIVGSTELTNSVAAETYFNLIQDILGGIAKKIESADGHIIDFAGDSVFAIFGAPVAVENAALAACFTALEIQSDIRNQSDRFDKDYGFHPKLRIGIGGGEVLIGGLGISDQLKFSALGSAVNLAARLQNLAEPGEIYCSDEINHEIEGFAKTENAGAFKLKGFPEEKIAFRLLEVHDDMTSLEARQSRTGHGYVGRQNILYDFRNWLQAEYSNQNVRLVFGEPGIGKSRFIHEAIADKKLFESVIISNCSLSTINEPFWALLDIVRKFLKIDDPTSSEKLEKTLRLSFTNSLVISNITSALLLKKSRVASKNDAVDVRRDLANLLKEIVNRGVKILVVEDIHWLDAQSAEIFGEVLVSFQDKNKVILLSRHEADFPWCSKLIAEPLELRPLKPENITDLMQQMLPNFANLETLSRKVFEKSEGNPFFAEEIIRSVKLRGDDDNFDRDDLLPSVEKIGTLQNLVFARFDKLPDELKTSLKFAAIIDRNINPEYLATQAGGSKKRDQVFYSAMNNGLIEFDSKTQNYRFSHALIQDSITGSLSRDHKQELHLLAAKIIGDRNKNDANIDATLAYHFDGGGEIELACQHYYLAAKSAFEVYALPICDAFLGKIDELLESQEKLDPEFVCKVSLLWCQCLDVYGNFAKIIRVYEKYKDTMAHSENIFAQTLCLSIYGKSHCLKGEIDKSLEIIEEAEKKATDANDQHAAAYAKILKLWAMIDHPDDFQNEIVSTIAEVEKIAKSKEDDLLNQLVLHMTALRYRVLGDIKNLDKTIASLYEYGEKNNSKWALAYAKWSEGLSNHIKRDLAEAERTSFESFQYAVPGTVDWQAANFMNIAAKSLAGDRTVRPEDFESQYQKCLEFGDHLFATPASQQAAAALILDGNFRQGWARLREAGEFAKNARHKASLYRQYLASAELMLTLAGIMPSQNERPKMHILDIIMAIRLRIGAVKRAERLYQKYFEFRKIESGFYDADAHTGLCMIAKSKKQFDKARHHFDRAWAIYDEQEYPLGFERLEELTGYVKGG